MAFLLAEQFPTATIEAIDGPVLHEGAPVAIIVRLGRDLTAGTGG